MGPEDYQGGWIPKKFYYELDPVPPPIPCQAYQFKTPEKPQQQDLENGHSEKYKLQNFEQNIILRG